MWTLMFNGWENGDINNMLEHKKIEREREMMAKCENRQKFCEILVLLAAIKNFQLHLGCISNLVQQIKEENGLKNINWKGQSLIPSKTPPEPSKNIKNMLS